MTESSPPAWGGDPSIAWRILLTAVPTSLPTVEQLAARQAALHEAQGWPAPLPVASGDAETLRRDLAELRDVPLVLGLAADQVVVSALYAYVDGLGLLDALAALLAVPVTSSARGVADRTGGDSLAGRLAEAGRGSRHVTVGVGGRPTSDRRRAPGEPERADPAARRRAPV